ncbi:hypothetical protein GGGNBK_23085 (plasmid) [Sporosarcina sp. ANT_H38]
MLLEIKLITNKKSAEIIFDSLTLTQPNLIK